MAKYMSKRMQWDFDSAAPDFPLFPFFRFEHKFGIPIPWPTPSESVSISTTVKPAIPQAWVSASAPFYKGLTVMAAVASDAAEPLSEPYLSTGAEYQIGLPWADSAATNLANAIQKPFIATPKVTRITNDFILYAGIKNYGEKGPEASMGISSCIQVGSAKLRARVSHDRRGKTRYSVSLS
uniref:Uncharacterized protein n=1 Tax=Hemiselmis andersenii TaxID=464988 RepID=A0A6U2AXG4_HEMAN